MGPAEGSGWVADVAGLAGLAVAGRILLAWLPPGRPGSHQGTAILPTWAASHLIGVAAASIGGALAESVGLANGTARIIAWNILGLLLVVRLATLPGALVPRHEPAPEHWWPSRALGVTVAAVVTLALLSRENEPASLLELANVLGALVLLAYGLELARAPSLVQALLCAAAATFLVFAVLSASPEDGRSGLCAAGAAAGTVGWLRRADQRALGLTAIGIAFWATGGLFFLPILASFALCVSIATPSPARGRAVVWCGIACVIGLAASRSPIALDPASDREPYERMGDLLGHWGLFELVATVTLMLPAGIVLGWIADRRARGTWNPSGAARGREANVLLLVVVLAIAASVIGVIWAKASDRTHLIVGVPIVEAWVLTAFVSGLGWTRWVLERPVES